MAPTPPAHPDPLPPPAANDERGCLVPKPDDEIDAALVEARDLARDVVKLTASSSAPFDLIRRAQALDPALRRAIYAYRALTPGFTAAAFGFIAGLIVGAGLGFIIGVASLSS